MGIELITILMFGSLLVLLIAGLPLAFSLGTVAVGFSFFLWGPSSIPVITTRVFSQSMNFTLVAAPLFIFMAHCIEESGIAGELYEAFYKWAGGVRGGLAVATIIICAILAACTGITATATVTMGVIALPHMMKYGYDEKLSIGTIASSGGLGILIPPSVPMVILALAGGQSLGKLFLGGMTAGIIITILFVLYIFIRGILNPDMCPAIEEKVSLSEKIASLKSLIGPLFLIVAVLGLILLGVTTPTEAAAFGAVGSIVCLAAKGKLNKIAVDNIFKKTAIVTGMVFWIIFAASAFTGVFNALGAQNLVTEILGQANLSPTNVIILFCAILFFLGMFLDPTGVIMIAAPVMCPIVVNLGFDPTWFGVIFVILVQVGYISPPFGYNLFYMKVVSNKSSMAAIYASVVPFLLIFAVAIALFIVFPEIILWLPETMITK